MGANTGVVRGVANLGRHLSTEERIDKLQTILDGMLDEMASQVESGNSKGLCALPAAAERIVLLIQSLGGRPNPVEEIRISFELPLPKEKKESEDIEDGPG